LGVITLKPDATSMLSLFCVLVCVLAQLSNNVAVQTVAMLVKKIPLNGFIGFSLVVDIKTRNESFGR
jgi:hypothetical protein